MEQISRRVCVYPGSFDPITLGHIDIIMRARQLFDAVIVAILQNKQKNGFFPLEQRKKIAIEALNDVPEVQIETFGGLLVDFMRLTDTHIIIRGIRAGYELDHEMNAALLNKSLAPDIETVYITASPHTRHISSSAAREIAFFGGDASRLLPASSWHELSKAINRR